MELNALKKKLEKNIETAAKLLYEFTRGSKLLRSVIFLAVFIAFFNPKTIEKAIVLAHGDWRLPNFYPVIYYLIIAGIFIYAVRIHLAEITIEKKAEKIKNANVPLSIKGPNAFTLKDAKLFSELQRNGDIRQLKEGIMHPDYRFGILTAFSGCGKTSLLNAGLGPAIRGKSTSYLIVTVSNQAIIDAVKRSAYLQEGIQLNSSAAAGLCETIKELSAHKKKAAWVIIFDQFEQFFIHNAADARSKIIGELKSMLAQLPHVKLLISIRNDFLDNMREVQLRLGYTLDASSNYFTLKNFTPDQAVAIFGVIAEKEKIHFVDKVYLKTFCSNDLASATDGLVSPIDIQIIAMIVNGYRELEVAFNHQTFKQLGGVNGMLKRYINEKLAVGNYFNAKNEGLYVLLTLIWKYEDGRRIKGGRLSLPEISKKMAVSISGDDLVKLLDWLEACKLVRLVAGDIPEYELSHEKLIEPVLSISNESETDLRKANVVMEKRVAEWVSNGRSRAYLLRTGEYFPIIRFKNAINWGDNEPIKRDYLRASKNRIGRKLSGWAAFVLFLAAAYFVYQTDWFIKNYRIRADAIAIYNDPSAQLKGDRYALTGLVGIAPDFVYKSIKKLPLDGTNYDLLIRLAAAYTDSSTAGQKLWKEAYSYCDSGPVMMRYGALRAIIAFAPKKDLNKILETFEKIKGPDNNATLRSGRNLLLPALAVRIAPANLDSAMGFAGQLKPLEQNAVYKAIALGIAAQNLTKALEITGNLKRESIEEQARLRMAAALQSPDNNPLRNAVIVEEVNWLLHSVERDFPDVFEGRYQALTQAAAEKVPQSCRNLLLGEALVSAQKFTGKDDDGNSKADARDAALADLAVKCIPADPALSAKCYSLINDFELKIEADILKAYILADKDKSRAETIWNDVTQRLNTLPVNVLEGRLFLKNLYGVPFIHPNPLKEKILDRLTDEIAKGCFTNGSAGEVARAVVIQFERAGLYRKAYDALSYSHSGSTRILQLAELYQSWINNKYTDPLFLRPFGYEYSSYGW